MNGRAALAAACLAAACLAAAGLAAVALAASATAAPASATVRVEIRPARVDAVLGNTVTIRSTVVNVGPDATTSLIAHLDVVSLGTDVYVDPEDWSSQRSVEVGPLPPGTAAELSWPVRTVDSGDFAVYVVLMPAGRAGPAPLATSSPVHLTVTGRRALSAGGTLPVDVGVPLLLALAVLYGRIRRSASGHAAPVMQE